jgi:hypothetical protein
MRITIELDTSEALDLLAQLRHSAPGAAAAPAAMGSPHPTPENVSKDDFAKVLASAFPNARISSDRGALPHTPLSPARRRGSGVKSDP